MARWIQRDPLHSEVWDSEVEGWYRTRALVRISYRLSRDSELILTQRQTLQFLIPIFYISSHFLMIYSFWIILSTWLVCTGWVLTSLNLLNVGGYVLSFLLLGFLILFLVRQRTVNDFLKPFHPWSKLSGRFRRPLPLVYLFYLIAALVGGALYPPTNYDALCYRLPRVLHWWSASQWHWIGGWNGRMDYSATGFEWLMAPLIILFKSDRLLFLINLISFALLPGLIYSAFTALGVSRRVAWNWMWILPTAYCFVVQAGSIGNDSFAAVYFLSAVVFAFRAVRTGRFVDAVLAMLSTALLTGAKASNLPLLLPLSLVLYPLIKILIRRSLPSITILLISIVISFLPMAAINSLHSGDWSGDPRNLEKMKLSNPVAGLVGNAMEIAIGAVAPPLLPNAKSLSARIMECRDKGLMRMLFSDYPRLNLAVGEIPNEESAGLGLGVTLLLLLSLGACFLRGGWGVHSRMGLLFGVLCWAALGVYMGKMGSESAARLVASYYPGLLVPLLLLNGQSPLVRSKIWQFSAVACQLAVVPALLLSPARPLLPVQSLMSCAEKNHILKAIAARGRMVYSIYERRSDSLALVRNQIPSGVKVIGFAGTGNESEYAFWKPFGERKVIDFNPQVIRVMQTTPLNNIDCVVGSENGIWDRFSLSASGLANTVHGAVTWEGKIAVIASRGPESWYVIAPKLKQENIQSIQHE